MFLFCLALAIKKAYFKYSHILSTFLQNQSVLKSRIKSRFPPKNLTELTAIDETLGFKGTLEVGSFATIDYKESFEAKRSSSIIHSGTRPIFFSLTKL